MADGNGRHTEGEADLTGVTAPKRKLIEVALPLEEINRESVREGFIYKGNPSAVHKWWAQRPLAAARAVLFAQLVDDPSAHPDRFPTYQAQEAERERLLEIIKRLAVWENRNNEGLLKEAQKEISDSCNGDPPAVFDMFAGGGSIPMEAQRLGLKAYASDVNPVAALINKALIEIPPRFIGQPPVFPGAAGQETYWPRTKGLAEDIRRYGRWIRDQAEASIGHLYPKAMTPDGREVPVIAWLWARTVQCPNPACGVQMPLIRSRWLSKKKGKEAYAVVKCDEAGGVTVQDNHVIFDVGYGPADAPLKGSDGTVSRNGASCVVCNSAVALTYIRSEGKAGRIGTQLMAIAAEEERRRVYFPPDAEHQKIADVPRPDDIPDTNLPDQAPGFRVQGYGMTRHADLFTNRQLTAISTFSKLVILARQRVESDCHNETDGEDRRRGSSYADALATYLAFAISKFADYNCSLAVWYPQENRPKNLFAMQAIPMVWDFPEINPFSEIGGSFYSGARIIADALGGLAGEGTEGTVSLIDAADIVVPPRAAVSTDPPYYDNVPYADLSDFFYVWLRKTLRPIYPDLLGTMLTPKASELIADQYRHGGKKASEEFFEQGFRRVFRRLKDAVGEEFPVVIYYAFRQKEATDAGVVSTGWQTFLEGLIESGFSISATWPVRTERSSRARDIGSNALASSIILACRPRHDSARTVDRRELIAVLRDELPRKLKEIQQGSIAPADLAQAAIGPGIAVFSRYARVDEPDGSRMRVRTALALINQILDEVLASQEGDFDTDTRWCVRWFEAHGYDQGPYGEAETLATALGSAVSGLERAGVAVARAGQVWLIGPDELPHSYDPMTDDRISAWEVALHLAKRLNEQGMDAAARLMAAAGQRVDLDTAKELAYLLFSICEKKGWAQQALLFNALGTSWSDLSAASRKVGSAPAGYAQGSIDSIADYDES